MNIYIQLEGYKAFAAGLLGMRTFMPKAMKDAMTEVGKLVKSAADADAPVARLRGRHRYRLSGTAQQPAVTIAPRPRWAYILIRGRHAGKKAPPVAAIRRWARRHSVVAPDSRDASYALARAIGRHGYAGRPYFGAAVKRVMADAERIIDRAMAGAVLRIKGDPRDTMNAETLSQRIGRPNTQAQQVFNNALKTEIARRQR